MHNKFVLITLAALGASSLFAQESHFPVTLGVKVGVPVTDMFSASNSGEFGDGLPGNYSTAVPRYELGISGEFQLPWYGLRFEVDGLYKRAGFDSQSAVGGSTVYRPTSFNEFEIPGLFKKNVAVWRFRPFVEAGASLRHIATISQFTDSPGSSETLRNNAIELQNRNSFGAVAGFGVTFKKGPFELTPEARYTRWANQSFTSANGLRTNLDQGDVLLGISF
jgi:hypothetical protein